MMIAKSDSGRRCLGLLGGLGFDSSGTWVDADTLIFQTDPLFRGGNHTR